MRPGLRRPARWPRRGHRKRSERVKVGLEQAELIALGVDKNVPLLLAGLADVGRARPELQETGRVPRRPVRRRTGPGGPRVASRPATGAAAGPGAGRTPGTSCP